MNALVPTSNTEAYRVSTEAADLCREMVIASAQVIQGRKYIKVEGWQAIAIAHGCAASARDVEKVEGGVRAIGEIRRMSDGVVIAEAEGFVGEDEPTWYGGEQVGYGKTKILPKRADYAIRAMAQTRAISRAGRSAFAHVVVMMNAGLSTTPAEEVPQGGFNDAVEGQFTPAPQKREWLGEAYKNKTAARAEIRSLKAKGEDATLDLVQFNHLVAQAQPAIDQLALNNDAWITGEDHEGNPFESVPAWIDRRRAELAPPAEDGMFAMLIASMKECQTAKSLAAWMSTNEPLIGELDDAAGRSFQLALDIHESNIAQMDTVRA